MVNAEEIRQRMQAIQDRFEVVHKAENGRDVAFRWKTLPEPWDIQLQQCSFQAEIAVQLSEIREILIRLVDALHNFSTRCE